MSELCTFTTLHSDTPLSCNHFTFGARTTAWRIRLVSTVPKKTSLAGDTFGFVYQDVHRLAIQAHPYLKLCATDDGKRAVNEVSPVTCDVLGWALLEAMYMGVSRTLLDNSTFAGRDNLGLHSVISDVLQDGDPLCKKLLYLKTRHANIKV